MVEFVFYKTGATSIQDVAVETKDGWKGGYSGKPEAAFVAEGFARVNFDVALAALETAQRDVFCTGPVLVDQETYEDMLEVLPPERVGSAGGWFMFSIIEHTCGNLTAWYGTKDDRYVCVTEEASASFAAIAAIMEKAS